MAGITLSQMYKKLGVGTKGLSNPIRLTKFLRPRGGIIRASLTEEQAEKVLTPPGLTRWRNGAVLGVGDVTDQVLMAAVEGEEGLIHKNPWPDSKHVKNQGSTIICGTVLLAGLMVANRLRNQQ